MMSRSSPTHSSGRGGLRPSAFGCVVAVGILVIIAIVVISTISVLYSRHIRSRVAEAEQHIRDMGQPVTLEEFDAYYAPVSTDKNAALVYGKAFEQVQAVDPSGEETAELMHRLDGLGTSAKVPADLQMDIQAHLVKCEVVFATLDRAALYPQARYPIDLRKGWDVELSHLLSLRTCARLESLRGTQAMIDNRPGDFVRSQENTLGMAKSLREEPLLISQLVRIAIQAIGVQSLADNLGRAPIPAESLAVLQHAYAAAEYPEATVRAFAGERCGMAETVRKMCSGEMEAYIPELAQFTHLVRRYGRGIATNTFSNLQRLAVLEQMQPLVEVSDLSWPERLEVARQTEAAYHELSNLYFVTKTFLPGMARATEAFARQAALVRMARVACAVERFRLANGGLPEDLNQLVPQYLSALPEDPFDGQPLRYKASGRGYRLYSIFADGKDDGGIQAEKNDGGEFVGDWVFEVER